MAAVDDRWGVRRRMPTGVGLGLRWAFMDEVLADPTLTQRDDDQPFAVPFFEIGPENYMRRGGFIPHALRSIAAHVPILSHGLMLNVGGDAPLDEDYLGPLGALLDSMDVAVHTDHLCWTGVDGHTLHDLLPLPTDAAAVEHCVDRIRRTADRLARPVALENISHYCRLGGGLDEAAFITEVLERADAPLMLDVGNVLVNATNYGFDPIAFLQALPLSRVVQMHVAGAERLPGMDGLLIDTHGADVPDEAAALMAWVVQRIGPVPIVLERDSAIPRWSELLTQVHALQSVYDTALALWDAQPPRPERVSRDVGLPVVIDSVVGIQRAVQRVVAVRSLPDLDSDSGRALLREAGAGPDDAQRLSDPLAVRLGVYRRLVRNGLTGVIDDFLPRTRAHLGADAFDDAVAAWLDSTGPTSRFFRDVPREFVAWWVAEGPSTALAVLDLARYEIARAVVEAVPSVNRVAVLDRIDLAQPLVLDDTVRLFQSTHPVLEDDATATRLLLYRDPDDEVAVWSLSPLAHAMLTRAMTGEVVGTAIPAAAADVDVELSPEILGRLSALLADLAERDIVRGCPASTAALT